MSKFRNSPFEQILCLKMIYDLVFRIQLLPILSSSPTQYKPQFTVLYIEKYLRLTSMSAVVFHFCPIIISNNL